MNSDFIIILKWMIFSYKLILVMGRGNSHREDNVKRVAIEPVAIILPC